MSDHRHPRCIAVAVALSRSDDEAVIDGLRARVAQLELQLAMSEERRVRLEVQLMTKEIDRG